MEKGMILSICGKTSDMCSATLTNARGNTLKEHDGYVPSFMPGEHWGDYIILEIDVDSGKILNWKKPTQTQIDKFIETGK